MKQHFTQLYRKTTKQNTYTVSQKTSHLWLAVIVTHMIRLR